MCEKFTFSVLLLIVFVCISGSVKAQNPDYVEETFTYDNGEYDATTVTNLTDGIGWSDGWSKQDGDVLTFNISKGVASVVGNAIRNFEKPLIDSGTEDIWIYTKLRSGTVSTAGYAGISLWNGESEDFFIGQEWNKTADAVRGGGWGGPNYTTAIEATEDVVFLIKIETMGSGEEETAYIWINPEINGAIPSIEDITGSFIFSMPDTYEFLSLRSDQTIFCDFIKIGTNVEKILGINTSKNQFERDDLNLKNYPNPVKGVTNIFYSLYEKGEVRIELFDTKGKIVRTYSNLNSKIGFHSVEIDVFNLNSGLYYYRLTQNNVSAIKKMVVIK